MTSQSPSDDSITPRLSDNVSKLPPQDPDSQATAPPPNAVGQVSKPAVDSDITPTLPPAVDAVGQVSKPAVDADITPTLPPAVAPKLGLSVKPGFWPAVPGYEIFGELGRGGMGVVYKARHLKLNRIVALKMILSGGHASAADLTRFLSEAQAVAALTHPNIVQIYEIGEHQGLPFFTLEFIDGGSLAGLVRDNPLSFTEAARIVEQLARGVHYAHTKGIVHRDLKPENVLMQNAEVRSQNAEVTRQGNDQSAPHSAFSLLTSAIPKITDFGLAKKIESGGNLTQTGAIVGTPSYMAPEQAEGKAKDVGPLADVYALGAILYRLITGRPPFQAATPMETVLQVVSDEPVPPSRLMSKTPRDLETICLKCLRKEMWMNSRDCEDAVGRICESNEAKPLAEDVREFFSGTSTEASVF